MPKGGRLDTGFPFLVCDLGSVDVLGGCNRIRSNQEAVAIWEH